MPSQLENSTESCPGDVAQSWYRHPAYQRYWRHYASVMSWCQAQRQSYHRAAMMASNSLYETHPRFAANPNQLFFRPRAPAVGARLQPSQSGMPSVQTRSPNNTRTERTPKHNLKRPRVVTPETATASPDALREADERAHEYQGEIEMEINDDMREFLLMSQKHRETRDAAKQHATVKTSKHETHIDATASVHKFKTNFSEEAPRERPGVRRTMEMKLLYGADAAKIHGMETAMQLTFDRNCDRFQPKLWPIMPFKIKFS